MQKSAYIFGQITGKEKSETWFRFLQAENEAIKKGYKPVNPLRLHGINSLEDYENHESKGWKHYMIEDIIALVRCDTVIGFLTCAKSNSKGVRLELTIAKRLEMNVIYL